LQTFSRVSSIASSLNFSLPPFLRILSQNVASSSALELPATPLLQKISKASLRAYRMKTSYRKHKRFNITISKSLNDHNLVEKSMILETIINICQVLVMQLNHLPNKNLKKEINFSFQNGINYSKTIQLEN